MNNNALYLYELFENETIIGVCGFENLNNKSINIIHIAISKNYQRHGHGRKIIDYLVHLYKLPIIAETDNDSVDFYHSCSFNIIEVQKNGYKRYRCKLMI